MNRRKIRKKDDTLARRMILGIVMVVVLLYIIITLHVFSSTDGAQEGMDASRKEGNHSLESMLIEGFPLNLKDRTPRKGVPVIEYGVGNVVARNQRLRGGN